MLIGPYNSVAGVICEERETSPKKEDLQGVLGGGERRASSPN